MGAVWQAFTAHFLHVHRLIQMHKVIPDDGSDILHQAAGAISTTNWISPYPETIQNKIYDQSVSKRMSETQHSSATIQSTDPASCIGMLYYFHCNSSYGELIIDGKPETNTIKNTRDCKCRYKLIKPKDAPGYGFIVLIVSGPHLTEVSDNPLEDRTAEFRLAAIY